jgi:hypothetical protein
LSADALNICTAIQHFETAINVIRNNLPELEGNSERPTKRARKDVNTSAEAKEACDIIVNQMKHRFQEAHHTKCFSLIEPQLFAAHKVAFPRELVISAVKYYPMLSKYKLESELSLKKVIRL